jgi:hypothetical protein
MGKYASASQERVSTIRGVATPGSMFYPGGEHPLMIVSKNVAVFLDKWERRTIINTILILDKSLLFSVNDSWGPSKAERLHYQNDL